MDERKASNGEPPLRSVTLGEVSALRRAGVVDAAGFVDAAYACRDADYWTRWSLRALLALGAGHLLAGIVFFFAFNWDALPPFGKFAVVEAAVVVAVVAALVAGPERPAGQALLIGATVMAGTLLAVIGQVYQTGADAWQVFVTWALLTVPWVLASRSAAHWLAWLVVALTAGNLYGYQVLLVYDVLVVVELSSLTAIAVGLVLVAREVLAAAGTDWLRPIWTRLLPVFVAPLIVFPATVGYVLGDDHNLLAAVTFAVLVGFGAVVYLRLVPDFAAVAIGAGYVSLILMAVGGRLIQETLPLNLANPSKTLFSAIVLTFWCAGVTTVTVKALIALRRWMPRGEQNG